AATEQPALVGRATRGSELELVEMEPTVLAGFRNYIGSVAANREAGTVAVTSPQGNYYAVIEAASRRLVSVERLVEVCGVAPDHSGFMVTTGAGRIVEANGKASKDAEHVWDNHMLRIEV